MFSSFTFFFSSSLLSFFFQSMGKNRTGRTEFPRRPCFGDGGAVGEPAKPLDTVVAQNNSTNLNPTTPSPPLRSISVPGSQHEDQFAVGATAGKGPTKALKNRCNPWESSSSTG